MKAFVLVGPTAVGKTELSFEIAGDACEIVSADSVQVYRHMDIGSGKPTAAQMVRFVHHCIDIVDPDYPFTAGEYCREAARVCDAIREKGRIPLFVGGTGLYIDSFFSGLSDIPAVDPAIRTGLADEMKEKGLDFLYEELARVDAEFAGSIHRNDRQRIFRGLEVYRGTGEPLSGYFGNKKGHASEDTIFIGLAMDMEDLRKRIDRRVDGMVGAGFFDEVILLRSKGYGHRCKSMKSIGYHEINGYIDGHLGIKETIEEIKRSTKKYAKRQMTWFKKNKKVRWFLPDQHKELLRHIRGFL